MSWCFRSLGQGTSVCFQWLEEDGGVGASPRGWACAADGSHWNGRSLGPWVLGLLLWHVLNSSGLDLSWFLSDHAVY